MSGGLGIGKEEASLKERILGSCRFDDHTRNYSDHDYSDHGDDVSQ